MLRIFAAGALLFGATQKKPSAPAPRECKGQERTDRILLVGAKSAQLDACSTPEQTRFKLTVNANLVCNFVQPGELVRLSILPNAEILSRTSQRTPEQDVLFDARTQLNKAGCTAISLDRVEHPLDPLALLEPELGVSVNDTNVVWTHALRVPLGVDRALALVRKGERRGKGSVEALEESLIELVDTSTEKSGVITKVQATAGQVRGLTVELKSASRVRLLGTIAVEGKSEVIDVVIDPKRSTVGKRLYFAGLIAQRKKVEAWLVFDRQVVLQSLEIEAGENLLNVEAFADAGVAPYEPFEH